MGRLGALRSSSHGWLWGGLPVVVAALVLFGTLRGAEEHQAREAFQLAAVQRLGRFENDVGLALSDLRDLGATFDAYGAPERAAFRRLAQAALADSSSGQALGWVPRVPDAQRTPYVGAARRDGHAGFDFTERLADGRLTVAGRRPEYYPVLFIEPVAGNEHAENIMASVHEPLLVLDAGLRIVSANRSFYGTFKVAPGATIGRFLYDLGDGQWDIPRLRTLLEEILPGATAFDGYEVEHDFPGLGRRTILLSAREIFREEVGSKIILLAMNDVTERKRAEEELRVHRVELEAQNEELHVQRIQLEAQNEELHVQRIQLEAQNENLSQAQEQLAAARTRYRDLYELAPVGYCSISEKGLILQANLTASTVLDMARGALVGQRLSHFIRKEDQDAFNLKRIQILESGEPQAFELRIAKHDGTLFWAHLTASAAQGADAVPAFHAGRQFDHAQVRRHRSRAVDRARTGAGDGWRGRDRERARQGLALLNPGRTGGHLP